MRPQELIDRRTSAVRKARRGLTRAQDQLSLSTGLLAGLWWACMCWWMSGRAAKATHRLELARAQVRAARDAMSEGHRSTRADAFRAAQQQEE